MSNTDIKDLVGRWKLVAHEFVTSDGAKHLPWGENPIGMAEFDSHGNFSAQITRTDRKPLSAPIPADQEFREAYTSYMAYFGTYKVVEEKKMLVNRVMGATNQRWVGGDQIRYYDYDGKRLTLRTAPFGSGERTIVGTLVWEPFDD